MHCNAMAREHNEHNERASERPPATAESVAGAASVHSGAGPIERAAGPGCSRGRKVRRRAAAADRLDQQAAAADDLG